MLRTLLLPLLLTFLPIAALAECTGRNLIAAMPADDRAALQAAAAAVPYPQGILWRAEKDGRVVHLVGSYHLDDPRFNAFMPVLAPMIREAAVVLVEAGPEEEKKLQAEVLKRPDFMFITDGPTLPELLPEADWQHLAEAMNARGIPTFLAAKFQPWYVSMMLTVAPCMMDELQAGAEGLDKRVIVAAQDAGIPIRPLEPFDTVFRLFGDLTTGDQISMIRASLATADEAEDYSATLVDTYFAGDTRLIWEFTVDRAYDMPGFTADEIAAEFARMETLLMTGRNRAWIPVIEAAAAEGPVFAAFGALHLPGHDGVLDLMDRAGWTLTRLPL